MDGEQRERLRSAHNMNMMDLSLTKEPRDPIIAPINRLLKRTKLDRDLNWYGGDIWVLDGITPVPIKYVVDTLRNHGANTASIDATLRARDKADRRRMIKREALRASASTKLSRAERIACGLSK